MLNYVRLGLLVVVVVSGIALPIVKEPLLAWIAGGGFVVLLILSHPAITSRLPNQDSRD